MQILSLNFLICTLFGVWRPVEWSSNGAKLLYNIFTYFVILSHYFVMLAQFMDIVLIVDNIEDFATNTLIFLTVVVVSCKATVIVIRRNEIINLVHVLMKTPFKSRDEDETAIQTKFDMFIRSCTIKYSFLVTCSVTGTTIGAVLNIMQGHLPYRIWLPFNYNVPLMFMIISIHQIITLIFTAMIDVGAEMLVLGLFLQTCAQLEIFENRLHKLIINKIIYLGHALSSSNKNNIEISECICHHLSIYQYAKTINIIFNQVFFVQFFASTLILCTTVYYLSIHITEDLSGPASLLVYTMGMFTQIFVYCWSGNEVTLKSMSVGDAHVYCMDWPLLSVNEKKELLMIMIRSTIPIKFTSSFLITLSLQSYSNILKTAYSAYNLLQK